MMTKFEVELREFLRKHDVKVVQLNIYDEWSQFEGTDFSFRKDNEDILRISQLAEEEEYA